MESRQTFGRTVIYSSVEEITKDNVADVLHDALQTHVTNSADIDYLYNYYKGKQPILYRQKQIRPEINNKIVENHALEIVDFDKGYVFGEPIQYVRRGEGDNVSEKIAQLNEYMFAEDKAAVDKQLAEWFYICGTAYRMVLPAKDSPISPFNLGVLDPRYAFVVYRNNWRHTPLMGVKYITNGSGDDAETIYSIYTKDRYFEVKDNQVINGNGQPHLMTDIPIVEYPANNARIGAFEPVVGMLDGLNMMVSNRMDGIEQFIQSFLKFVNCDITSDKFDELKEQGAILIKSDSQNPADVDIISSELNQSQAQISKEDMYQMVLTICGIPDRNGGSRSTGDTGQAVILRDGWSAAESKARDVELMFKGSEKRFLQMVLNLVNNTDGFNDLDLTLGDIDIKFTRNRTDNLLVKTQGMQDMLSAGIHPQVAISSVGLFSDPEPVYLDSVPYLEKWLTSVENSESSDNTAGNDREKPESRSSAEANPQEKGRNDADEAS